MGVVSNEPPIRGPGRPPRLDDEDRAVLVELLRAHPDFGADNLTKLFVHKTGLPCSDTTIRAELVKMGWRRMNRPPEPASEPAASAPKDPVRYAARHRLQPSATSYPSDLTDGEWSLLEPLLRGRRQRAPCGESTRATVNAVLYIARTGCQWRFLPHDFPNWQAAAKTYYRWVDRGVWEAVNDALRRQVRVAAGREPEPTAAIIDSQSVKTTEKGGSTAMMRAKKSTKERGISS